MRDSIFRQIRRRGRRVLGAAAYWSGLAACYEAAARPRGGVVLMYHSVASEEMAPFIDPPNRITPHLFEQQMAFLARHRHVVSLSALVESIASGSSPAAGTVAITFDDGYLDTLTIAAPILARHGLPATLYLATGYISRGESQWADLVHCWFRSASGTIDWASERLDFTTAADAQLARRIVHRRLLQAGYDERSELLSELKAKLAPDCGPLPRLSLDWDTVRELRQRHPQIEVGGHTRGHVDLSTHRGPAAMAEIDGCADDLRRELGAQPRHFSFPYGRWCAETRAVVSERGWDSAVADGDTRRVGAGTDRFLIPRMDAPASMTELRLKTSGAYPGVLFGLRA